MYCQRNGKSCRMQMAHRKPLARPQPQYHATDIGTAVYLPQGYPGVVQDNQAACFPFRAPRNGCELVVLRPDPAVVRQILPSPRHGGDVVGKATVCASPAAPAVAGDGRGQARTTHCGFDEAHQAHKCARDAKPAGRGRLAIRRTRAGADGAQCKPAGLVRQEHWLRRWPQGKCHVDPRKIKVNERFCSIDTVKTHLNNILDETFFWRHCHLPEQKPHCQLPKSEHFLAVQETLLTT